MNQPTREEYEELKERVRKLEQQQTEPIRITRLEIDQGGMQGLLVQANKRLDSVQEDTNILKIQMEGARADILKIRESQADLRDTLKEHSEDHKAIKEKQDAHSELLGQLINVGESHTANMATKDDIARIEKESAKRFNRLEGLMLQILERLPKAEGE